MCGCSLLASVVFTAYKQILDASPPVYLIAKHGWRLGLA
jgi:hypothetical protein